MPAISVVMPVFNGMTFLHRAIESIQKQTLTDWELLAVDDASTDGSADQLHSLSARDPRIRVFRHPTKRGPAAARNTALAAVQGEWIAYLDQDDEFYPDHLARLHGLRGRADVVLFGYDWAQGRMTPARPSRLTEIVSRPLGVAHRRRLLARSGYFNEALGRQRPHDQGSELWRRFAQAGAAFAIVPYSSGRSHAPVEDSTHSGSVPAVSLPSPPTVVEIEAGPERIPLLIPKQETWRVRQLFEKHEYGGIPRGVLQPAPIVLDIGANCGVFAAYACLLCHAGTVHCFEPAPSTLTLLRRNAARFPAVTVHPFGLGQTDGEVELYLDSTNTGANSLKVEHAKKTSGRVPVQVRDAGAVWDELKLGEVDVLKVDTEGCEADILKAFGSRLDRVRVVMAEYHTAEDRRRIDALLPNHLLFGTLIHSLELGVVKYLRTDLASASRGRSSP